MSYAGFRNGVSDIQYYNVINNELVLSQTPCTKSHFTPYGGKWLFDYKEVGINTHTMRISINNANTPATFYIEDGRLIVRDNNGFNYLVDGLLVGSNKKSKSLFSWYDETGLSVIKNNHTYKINMLHTVIILIIALIFIAIIVIFFTYTGKTQDSYITGGTLIVKKYTNGTDWII